MFGSEKIALAGLLSLLVFSRQADCSEEWDQRRYLSERLGYACIRWETESNADIASCIQDPDGTVKILSVAKTDDSPDRLGREQGTYDVALFLCGLLRERKEISTGNRSPTKTAACQHMQADDLFTDSGISEAEADGALKSMGIYGGNMLDGIQRSSLVKGYRCMLKLQPSGMLTMVISRI